MTIPAEEYRQRQRGYERAYRERQKGSPLADPTFPTCLIDGCYVRIPATCTVCGPEHGAILTAQFDAWRANGGPANVFGRYRHA